MLCSTDHKVTPRRKELLILLRAARSHTGTLASCGGDNVNYSVAPAVGPRPRSGHNNPAAHKAAKVRTGKYGGKCPARNQRMIK